ncbi:acyl-CoA thioesterase [Nocardia spumae]|uniref:acyl-CoA thioesterase n=1 Tax=Nocardia spumae TaxID=2887190 RepID=UPI001D15CFE8|nr:thioesterase family protein [Nocardia spumae]
MNPTDIRTHPFDLATGLTAAGEGSFRGHTSAPYSNMVGPFGGITAATALRAVLDDPRCAADPLSLTVNFAGPIAEGPFTIDTRPVRTNRSTQHWTLTLSQGQAVATTATVVCGTRRPTWSDTEISPPPAPPADSVPVADPPDFPVWMRNYEMRFVEGGGPLTPQPREQASSTTTLWVRDTPARPLDFPAVTALSDVFIPRVMVRTGRMVAASTVSLTVYFHADAAALAEHGAEPVLATARAQHFGRGFFDQSAHLWGADGTPLTTTHQLVYFKD